MAPPDEKTPQLPRLVDWASRNSGVIFFVLLLSVAMIEGVAIYASKRRAAALSPSPPPTQP